MKTAHVKASALAAALAATLFAGAAQADSLTTDPSSLGLGTGLIFDVTIGGNAVQRSAGSFNITNNDTGTSFAAFCADISTGISPFALVGLEYDKLAAASFITDPTKLQNVQSLYDQRYGTLDLTSKINTAAFQISLWELLDDGNLGTGNVMWSATADADKSSALAMAGNWLTNGHRHLRSERMVARHPRPQQPTLHPGLAHSYRQRARARHAAAGAGRPRRHRHDASQGLSLR